MKRNLQRILHCQLAKAEKTDHPYLLHLVDENDLHVWHFMVVNLPAPYAGGEYIFRLRAPETFPQAPPELVFLTPNGVFDADAGKVCISIGEFHAHDRAGPDGAYGWRPVLGMIGFAGEVVNALIVSDSLGGGVRVRNDEAEAKRVFAEKSAEYNAARFPQLYARFVATAQTPAAGQAGRDWLMWTAAAALVRGAPGTACSQGTPHALERACGTDWAFLKPVATALSQGRDSRLETALMTRDRAVRRALLAALTCAVLTERGGAEGSEAQDAFTTFLTAFEGAVGRWRPVLIPLVEGAGAGEVGANYENIAAFLDAAQGDKTAAAHVLAARLAAGPAGADGSPHSCAQSYTRDG